MCLKSKMKNLLVTFVTLLRAFAWAAVDLEQFCVDKSLNEVVVHPQDCRGYIICSEQPTVEYCEEGLYFDMNSLICNWPENVNCQLSARQTGDDKGVVKPTITPLAAFDIMTGQLINPMLGYNPLNVLCRHFGAYFLPSPRKCRSYYLCAYGHMHELSCGPHTLWDYKLQQCVMSHQAVCYQFNQEEEKEINVTLDNIMMVCYPTNANISSAEAVHVTSTEYITTLPTTTTTTTISPPTPPTITNAVTITKKPTFSNPYNITCPVKRQSYVAHPEDCSKYFMCIMGTAIMTSCPKGLLWDSKKTYCDVATNVNCVQQNKITESQTVVI